MAYQDPSDASNYEIIEIEGTEYACQNDTQIFT